MGWGRLSGLLVIALFAPLAAIGCDVGFAAHWSSRLDRQRGRTIKPSRTGRPRRVRLRSAPDQRAALAMALTGLLPPDQQPKLKAALRERGMSRNAWKLLCRHGVDLIQPIRRSERFIAVPLQTVVDVANVFAAVGRDDLPPPELLVAADQLCAAPECIRDDAGRQLLGRLLATAWAHIERPAVDAPREEALSGDRIVEVSRWWLRRRDDNSIPANADWSWLTRRWWQACEEEQMARCPCVSFGREWQLFEYGVVPLRNYAELRRAGARLDNCMRHAHPADSHPDAYFLIVDDQSRAVAMFHAASPQAPSSAREVLGPRNLPTPAWLRQLADVYLAHEYAVAVRGLSEARDDNETRRGGYRMDRRDLAA